MSKKVSFSNEHSTFEEVDTYFGDSSCSLNYFYDHRRTDDEFKEKFFGKSLTDIDAELKQRQEILERMCVLEILTMIEAWLRLDYLTRCQEKKRDALSKKFRVVYKNKGNKASLEDDIMGIWRDHSVDDKKRMDQFGQALKHRHWLAHGRYWQPKVGSSQWKVWDRYDEVYRLAKGIFEDTQWHKK